jgi:hypothetical protein
MRGFGRAIPAGRPSAKARAAIHLRTPGGWLNSIYAVERDGLIRMHPNALCSLMLHKMVVTLPVLWIMAATTMPLATAQEAALSEGERHGLAACLVKCPDGDKACVNRCMSKSQTKGVVWSDATRACIRGCRIQNAANEVIFGCVAGCLDRMVR